MAFIPFIFLGGSMKRLLWLLAAVLMIPIAQLFSVSSAQFSVEKKTEANTETRSEQKIETATFAGEGEHTTLNFPGASVQFRPDEVRYGVHGGTRFGYRFEKATIGGVPFAEATRKKTLPARDGDDVVYRRGAVVERYRAVGGELEQLFEIAERPAGEGDLVITGRATANKKATSVTAEEIAFDDLKIHDAVAIDAAGRRLPLALGYDARHRRMTLTVPAEWLVTAAFPLVIDPLVGSPFACDAGIQYIDCNNVHSLQGGRFLTHGGSWARFLNSGTGAPDGAQFPVPAAGWGGMSYLASVNKYLVGWPTLVGGDEAIGVYLIDAASGAVSNQGTIVQYTDDAVTTYWIDQATVAATSNGWVVGWVMLTDDDSDPTTTISTVSAHSMRVDATGASTSTALLLRDKSWDSGNTFDDHDWGWNRIECAAVHDDVTNSDRFAMTWADEGWVNDGDADYYAVFGAVVNTTAWTLLNDFIHEDFTIGWDSDSWASVSDPHIAGDETNNEFLFIWLRANFDGWYSVKAKRRKADGSGATAFYIKGSAGNSTADYSPGRAVYSPVGDVYFVTWHTAGNIYAATIDGGTNTDTANDIPIAVTVNPEVTAFTAVNDVDSRIIVGIASGASSLAQMFEIQSIPASPGPTITTTSLPAGSVGAPYSQQLQYVSGSGVPAWSVIAGSLPAGLSMSSSGLISGTPTTEASYPFTVQVTATGVDTQALTIDVGPYVPPPPVITTSTLPGGVMGGIYNQQLTYTGGAGSPSWDLVAGALPTGLSLDTLTGEILGSCGENGTFGFTVQLTDGGVDEKDFTITVTDPLPPDITTTTLPDGTTGVAYSQTIQYTGGSGSGFWGVISGTLPTGVALDAATGTLSGTPTVAGLFSFTVQVNDVGGSDTQALTVNINAPAPPPVITTTSLPDGTQGVFYSQTLAKSGGAGTPFWSLVGGALPAGLSLNTFSGTISGTPTAAGVSSFTVQVSDGGTDTQVLSLTIAAPGTTTTTDGGGRKKQRRCFGSAATMGSPMMAGVAIALLALVRRKRS
jgi:hypothetical protein